MTTLQIQGKDYELIEFNKKMTNKSITTTGIMLAKGYLAIADAYRIYNTISGEPLIRNTFQTLELCIKFATMLENVYKDYFELWDAYPNADIISWCKYSVDDGVTIFETVEYLETIEVITQAEINKGIDIAKERSKKWKI